MAPRPIRERGCPRDPWLNVWLGATVVNQTEADRDIPKLLSVPAVRRFLSIEPMLGPIRLEDVINSPYPRHAGWPGTYNGLTGSWWPAVGDADQEFRAREENLAKVDWIICGGESGPHARPLHPDWVRSLRDQCAAAEVPFLFKQWGEYVEWTGAESSSPSWRFPHPDNTPMVRVGKRAAGRLLDGATWTQYPQPPGALAAARVACDNPRNQPQSGQAQP